MPASASQDISSQGEIVIDCPVPPSLNRLWRVGGGRRRVYKDPKYKRWIWEFLAAWKFSQPLHGMLHKPIEGPFDVEILIHPKRKRDCDNNAKALLDAAQGLGIIANDGNARRVVQELVEKKRAPLGCRLRITPIA